MLVGESWEEMESDLVGETVGRRKGISKDMRRIPKVCAGVIGKAQLSRAYWCGSGGCDL